MTESPKNLPVQTADSSIHNPQHLTNELASFKDTAGQWWMELEMRKIDILQKAAEELGVDDEGNPSWENYDRTLSELRKAEDPVSSAIAEGFFKIACPSPYELRLVVSAQRVVAESCGFLPHQLKAPDADEDAINLSHNSPLVRQRAEANRNIVLKSVTAEEGLKKLRAYLTDQVQLMGKVTGEEEGAQELFDSHFNALAIANELIERIGAGKRLA